MTTLVMNQQVRAMTTVAVPKLYPRAWLLTLLPVSVLVLADLSAGTVRPLVWAARYVPGLLALVPVAWAHSRATPRSLRLRKELRLVAPLLLILLPVSSLQLLADAPLPTIGLQLVLAAGLICSAIMTVLVPIAGWSGEQKLGTLAESMTSPRAANIAFEKVGVSAYFIAVSALSLASSTGNGAAEVLGVSAAAVAVGPAWFLILRAQAPAVAASFFVPLLVLAVPSAFFPFESSRDAMGLMAAYAVVMLALTPRALRAGPARPPSPVMVEPVRFGQWRMRWPKWVGVEHRLLHIGWATVAVMPLGYGLMYAMSNAAMREGLFSLPLLLGAFLCVIGPAIALVEHQQLVLQQLVAHPRASVFRSKFASTLLLTCVGGLAVPLALGAFSAVPSAGMTVFFVVVGSLLWSISFAASSALKTQSVVALATLCTAAGAALLQLFALVMGSMAVMRTGPWAADAMSLAALVVLIPAALLFAYRRIVLRAPRAVRDAVMLMSACVTYAFLLGVSSAVLELLTRR